MARKIAATLAARKWALASAVLVIATAVVLGIAARNAASDSGPATTEQPVASASSSVGSASPVPTTPPEPTCDSADLKGPSAPPSDAVEVSTTQSLADVVAAHSPKTTYWLAPGNHRLGKGAYSQVIPHPGDTFIGAPDAVLDGGHKNRYAFGGDARDVTIKFLTVQHFGSSGDNNNEGVVNHDSASGWTVSSSTIRKNAGAGVMLGSDSKLIGNCLRDNGQYGFNAYHADGVRNVVLDSNEILGNNTDDWEKQQPGCGCTGGGKFWETHGARVTDNYVHDNRGVGLWADSNNVGFRFEGNYISDNDSEGIMYETSYNALIVNNTFVRNALVKGPTNPGFPASAIFLSESGSDSRVKGPHGDALRVSGNVFVNNWSGVVAWENADRFAGSPANTSSGVGTLVNRSVATVSTCATKSKVKKKPFYDDCRWKTQNVMVEGNDFALDRSQIHSCEASTGCGFNGIFSNYGTYPKWSPYKKEAVEKAITFKQNNTWRNNTYRGDWHFMVKETGNTITWGEWTSAPYHQDAGSGMN